MKKPVVGVALRERLGEDGTHSLHDYVDSCGELWRQDVITACNERMDLRLERFALRVELLRWTFAFWLGNFATTAGLMALLIRLLQP